MDVEVRQERSPHLATYAGVPMAFTVDRVWDITDEPGGRFSVVERTVTPYVKDYDAAHRPWFARCDSSAWTWFSASIGDERAGGAAVAPNGAGMALLDGRLTAAVLWDIRVKPDRRWRGVGTALFRAVELWTRTSGYRELLIETQHTNVPACHFYRRQECEMVHVERGAYPTVPADVKIVWRKLVAL